jgi:L-asparaginase II
MGSQVLANVIRGETVESVHRGHLIAIDGDGKVIRSIGSPSTVTYFRSASKAFQAMPFIVSGAADAFGYSEEEVALACASHSGEQQHVRIAKLMLERAEMTEAHLRCGTHLPFSEKESERMQREGEYPTQLHNNCSGKHAAMLAFAKHIGADVATYEHVDNPVQQEILTTVAQFAELPENEIAIGIDGCAAPNFAMPVAAMAKSFMNLMSPPEHFDDATRSACSRIVSAMVKFPELIGGSERLDTILMRAAPGEII